MAVIWRGFCCGAQYLRSKCFFIGYLNLIASALNLGFHLVVLSTITDFFSCDVNLTTLHTTKWTWLEPFIVIMNIGTQGFYPFPLLLSYYDSMGASGKPRCYPGMVHLYRIDVIEILIHIVWLRLVVAYITALHKKDPDTMRMFFGISAIKVVLQLFYFAYTPPRVSLNSEVMLNSFWVIKVIDICVATTFLMIMNSYIKAVRAEKAAPAPATPDQPPSYVECITKEPPLTVPTVSNDDKNVV